MDNSALEHPPRAACPRAAWLEYAIAVAAVAVATLVRLALDSAIGDHYPFITYFLAVAVVAWVGCTGPAIFSLVVGGLLAFFLFIPPRSSLPPTESGVVGTGLFLVVGGVVVALSHTMRAARGRCERLLAEAVVRQDELRQAVAAEAEQRERLRTTLASIGDAVISTDRDGHVTYLNAVAESLTGWTNEAAAGVPLADVFRIVNESTRQPVENPAIRALNEGVIVGLANHTILIARDGTERPIDDSAAPIRCKDGQLVGCVLVFRDISERHRAEARVQAERDRVQLVADAVPALISYIGTDARYRLNNRAYETWFGHPRGELVGRHMRDVLGEAAWAAIRPHVEAALAGRAVSYEAEVPYRDGGTRWIMATYTPDAGEDGAIRGVVAHVADITALKRAEQQTATTLESITDAFVRFDRGWRVVYVNAEAERITRRPRAELLGQSHWELFPTTVGTELAAEYRRAVAEQVTVELENYYEPWGRWLSIKGYPSADGGLSVYFQDVTDRKRVEAELARERERLGIALHAGRLGVYEWHVGADAVWWSPETYPVFGVDPATFRPTTAAFIALVHPDDRDALWRKTEACVARREVFDHEYRVVRPDGAIRWVYNRSRVAAGPGGEVERITGVAADITERKRAEEQLRESEERFRGIFSQSVAGVAQTDMTGRFVLVNQRYCEIVGRPAEELTGLRMQDITCPDDLPRNLPLFQAMVDGGPPFVIEKRYVRPDGSHVWVSNSVSLVRDGDGGPKYVVAVSLDITERRRSEEQLRESERRLELVLRSINDHIVSYDREWRYTYVNDRAAEILGRPKDELLGRCIWTLFPDAVGNQYYVELHRALAEQRVVSAEHFYAPFDTWFENHIYPSPDGVTVFAADVSARKRAEAERERLLRQVEGERERLSDVFRQAPAFMCVLRGPDHAFEMANDQYFQLIGRRDILGKTVRDVFPEIRGQGFIELLDGVFASGEPFIGTGMRIVLDQTGERYVDFVYQALRDPDGTIAGVMAVGVDMTARHTAEEGLRRSEARLRRVFESNVVGMIRWDLDRSLILDANDEFLRMTGYTRDDVAAGRLNFRHMTPAEWTPRNEEGIRTIRAEGHAGPYEKEYFRKDGSRVPLLIAGTRFEDSPSEGMSLIIDISDRKRSEQEIARLAAESERQRRLYETVLTNTPDFMYVFSLDHRVIYANDALIRMWGRGHDGAIGKTFLEIGYEPWHAEMHDREIDRVRATKQPIRGEVPFDGTHGRREYDYIFVPVIGADGEVEAVAGTTRDVTERKRVEEAYRLSEERLRLVVESATGFAIFTMDGAGIVTGWNSGAERLFQYTDAEIVGRSDSIVYTREEAAEGVPEREIRKAAAEGRAVNERWHVRKDGSRFWGSGLVQPLRMGGGKIVGFLKILRDMTEARQWQETLERQAEELKAADRRKDEFLATLAHELRNPLAPIRNGLEVIRRTGANGTVEQARSMMERQLGHMVRLVDDLLDVSRVTSGKLELRRELVELRAVLDAAVETTRPLIEQAGHDLAVVVPDEAVFVDGDPIRLAQIVSNLLTNSAKYTHRGGRIRASVGREGGTALVSVQDDGIGIPPGMLEKVFEMFTQVDRTLEKTTGGLGIGLSLVKGLVEMHGGTIEARSAGEGKGSEFVVRLPVVTPAAGGSEQPDGRADEVAPAGCRRILVVDDSADSADSLGQILEILGNEVRTAYDGESGVEAAGAFRPAVVLCDIGMPKVSGYDVARRIRGQSWGRDTVLVALTGWGQEDDRRKTAEAGFDYHLVKPVEIDALMKLLAGLPTT